MLDFDCAIFFIQSDNLKPAAVLAAMPDTNFRIAYPMIPATRSCAIGSTLKIQLNKPISTTASKNTLRITKSDNVTLYITHLDRFGYTCSAPINALPDLMPQAFAAPFKPGFRPAEIDVL